MNWWGLFRQRADPICFWVVVIVAALSPLEYWAILSIPDSTDYFLQQVVSSKSDDGRDYIYVGDNLHVTAYNWRHRINGNCLIHVDRNRETVGGKFHGKRTTFQSLDQKFIGDGFIRRTSWPILPAVVKITEDWFDDPEAQEQEIDIFTTGTFNCNALDSLRLWLGIPRVHHNAAGAPERERTRVVLKRKEK